MEGKHERQIGRVGRTLLSAAFDSDFAFALFGTRVCELKWPRKQGKVKSGGQECPPHMASLLLLLGDDYVFDLVVGGLGDDLFLHEFVLGAIRAAVDDLLRISVADSR